MSRARQKSVEYMTDLLDNFSDPWNLMDASSAGKMTAEEASLVRPFRWCMVQRQKELDCAKISFNPLEWGFEPKILSSGRHLTANKHICNAVRTFVEEKDGIQVWGEDDIRSTLTGLSPVLSFP